MITTLPGDIPGLLRRGSPVRRTADYLDERERNATVHAVRADGALDLTYLRDRGRYGEPMYELTADTWSLETVALDLTDPTGRAHAAWWARAARTADTWSLPENDAVDLALLGVPLKPYEIMLLRNVVLRLAGRAP